MIGNSSLKPFHAAVTCAGCIYTTTWFSNHVTKVLKSWHSIKCAFTDMYLGEFKLSVGALSPLNFWHLNMLSFLSVPLTPEHLLWIQRLLVWQSIAFTPNPLEHTPQGHLTFLVGFWASLDEPSISVLPTFILRPQFILITLCFTTSLIHPTDKTIFQVIPCIYTTWCNIPTTLFNGNLAFSLYFWLTKSS